MANIIGLFEAYGLLTVFAGVLIEQLGAPIPAVPFLLLAGAHSAADGLFALKALVAAVAASMIADTVWYRAGRRYGRSVLGLLCRVSISPGTCVQKSEASFSRRGVLTLLFAKFIPGVSALATPMAGALHMPLSTFILVDLAGSVLWVGSGLAAGLGFHDQVKRLMSALEGLGSKALLLVGGAILLYVVWRSLRRAGLPIEIVDDPVTPRAPQKRDGNRGRAGARLLYAASAALRRGAALRHRTPTCDVQR